MYPFLRKVHTPCGCDSVQSGGGFIIIIAEAEAILAALN